jgi:hypothetical protein
VSSTARLTTGNTQSGSTSLSSSFDQVIRNSSDVGVIIRYSVTSLDEIKKGSSLLIVFSKSRTQTVQYSTAFVFGNAASTPGTVCDSMKPAGGTKDVPCASDSQ